MSHSVRAVPALHSPRTSGWSPVAALIRDIPMLSSGTMSQGHQHSTAPSVPWTQTWSSAKALDGTSPWPQVSGMATHIRLLLSAFESPVLSLFIMLKLPHISLPSDHVVVLLQAGPTFCTLWWLLLQAGHTSVSFLGGILHLCCMACWQAGVYDPPGQYIVHVPTGLWVSWWSTV